jgi:hypothetical protein
MAYSPPWTDYTDHLAELGEWSPMGAVARDAVAMVKENPGGPEVALQAVQLLQKTWQTLPQEIRNAAMGALKSVGDQVFEAWDKAAASMDGNFIAGIVVAGIDAVFQIAEGIKGTNDIKRAASNYEHGNAQAKSMRGYPGHAGVFDPHGGLYTVVTCYTYSQFVKLRPGGNYDVKPCFTRAGLERDRIFIGHASPADGTKKVDGSPACAYERKQRVGDSFGPFNYGPCHRKLGISAMLWPWWSAAYEAKPLQRWQGSPEGAPFQAGLSADTNALLIGQQTNLITDATVNLQQSMRTMENRVQAFLNFWDWHTVGKYATPPAGQQVGTTTVHQIWKSNMRDGGESKLIDPREDPNHEPSKSAAAYWYYDATGAIQPYDNQPDASRDLWGVALPDAPANQPQSLGVTITQYNAVLAARTAFAERRLATLRTPALVRGIITDVGGVDQLDRQAKNAIEYARASTDKTLPYPGGATPKRATARKGKILPKQMHLPGRIPPIKTGGGVSPVALGVGAVAAAAAIGGAVYFNKGK